MVSYCCRRLAKAHFLLLAIWHQHSWNPSGTQFSVSQTLCNCFEWIKAYSYSSIHFPGFNRLVFTNQLIHSPIFCHCCSVRTASPCHVLQHTTTITGTQNPLPNCAHTDCHFLRTFFKCQWILTGQMFFAFRNSMTHCCFICRSMSLSIFIYYYSPDTWLSVLKLAGFWW